MLQTLKRIVLRQHTMNKGKAVKKLKKSEKRKKWEEHHGNSTRSDLNTFWNESKELK